VLYLKASISRDLHAEVYLRITVASR
jgi:hypothetical protein